MLLKIQTVKKVYIHQLKVNTVLTLLCKCMYYFASQVSASSGDTEQIRKLRSQVSEVERERDSLKHEVEELTFKLDEQLAHGHGMLKYKK